MASFADLITTQISEDLLWREEELAILRKQLIQAVPGTPQERTLLRTNLAMIYAHYEGFCKFALGVYIDALEKLKIKRKDLRWPIAANSLSKFYKELIGEGNQTSFFARILEELNDHLGKEAVYDRPDNIANLWPDLLREWLSKFNIESKNISAVHAHLESLVNNRNQVAHGKKLTVKNRAELDKYADAALMAMHEVAIGVTEALENKSYLRRADVRTIMNHAT